MARRSLWLVLALAAALAAPTTAGAEAPAPHWVIVSQDPIHTDYVDVASITRTGNLAAIWVVQDFHNVYQGVPVPMGPPGKEFLSIKLRVEIQCIGGPNQPVRALFYATYTGHMGAGSIVDGGEQITPWDKKISRGIENFACG